MSMASLIVQTHVMIADPDNINWVQVRYSMIPLTRCSRIAYPRSRTCTQRLSICFTSFVGLHDLLHFFKVRIGDSELHPIPPIFKLMRSAGSTDWFVLLLFVLSQYVSVHNETYFIMMVKAIINTMTRTALSTLTLQCAFCSLPDCLLKLAHAVL